MVVAFTSSICNVSYSNKAIVFHEHYEVSVLESKPHAGKAFKNEVVDTKIVESFQVNPILIVSFYILIIVTCFVGSSLAHILSDMCWLPFFFP